MLGALLVVTAVVAVGLVLWVRRGPDRSAEALCDQLGEARELDQAFLTLDPATLGPRAEALDDAAAVAPSDIEPQVQALADFVTEVVAAIDDAGGDRQAALTQALADRQEQVPTVEAAGQAVQSWSAANCGVPLGDGTTAPDPGAPAGSAPDASGTAP